MSVAAVAARKVVNQYTQIEYDDLLQEAYLILATRHRQMRRTLAEGGPKLLHHALWCDLTDYARKETRLVSRETVFHEEIGGAE